MRFDPPTVTPDPALRLILRAAFAPSTATREPASGPSAGEVASLISQLDLGPRIAARHSGDELGRLFGRDLAADLRAAHRTTVAQELALSAAASQVERLAGERGIPLVWLKFEALRRGGFLAAGSRRAGDVDVLVPPDRIHELQEALLATGCRDEGLGDKEHQLALLAHRGGGGIELHRLILGVRPEGAVASWGFAEAQDAGQLRPLPSADGPGIHRPSRKLMAAHAVVHGIAHHGDAPHTYPGLRMVADLQDLGAGPDWAEPIVEWLGNSLSRDEVTACLRLAEGLGRDPEAWLSRRPDEAPEAALLHHLLAGALDERYRKALRFRLLQRPLSDRSRPLATWKALLSTVFPSRAQIDAIYGRPKRPWGYWGWRLIRPFDLAFRALRYAWSRLTLR